MKKSHLLVSLCIISLAFFSCEVDPISEEFEVENQILINVDEMDIIDVEIQQRTEDEDDWPEDGKFFTGNSDVKPNVLIEQRTEDEDDWPEDGKSAVSFDLTKTITKSQNRTEDEDDWPE